MTTSISDPYLSKGVAARSRSHAALAGNASRMSPVTLDEVLDGANLQQRVDRKYLVSANEFAQFAALVPQRFRALEIDGQRIFRYESVYFDTADSHLYRDHRQGRRRRYKVRTRTYLDSGETLFEVKVKGLRGRTIKHRIAYRSDRRGRIDEEAEHFVAEVLWNEYGLRPPRLEPSLTTRYRRGTVVDLVDGARLTCDVDLACSDDHRTVRGPDRVLLESKSTGSSEADNLLAGLGMRPISISKYAVGTALLNPHLPANQWNRLLRREFGWRRE